MNNNNNNPYFDKKKLRKQTILYYIHTYIHMYIARITHKPWVLAHLNKRIKDNAEIFDSGQCDRNQWVEIHYWEKIQDI